MITLKELSWNNCFSYGENNTINFQDSTLTQILGTNGVGKSSIPLILEEVLYNKNSKGVKKADIPNRHINNGYDISLTFSKGEDEYEVTVFRKASAKVTLTKNGEDISSHTATNTYKSIQDILGIEFKTFSQVVYQNSNSSLQFLTATDSNRKKFLIELLNLDNYLDLFEKFKGLTKEHTDDRNRLEGQREAIEKWLENNKLESTEVLPLLDVPKKSEEDQKEASSILAQLRNIHDKNIKIAKNNKYKEDLSRINLSELKNSTFTEILDTSVIEGELGGLKQDFTARNRLITKMEGLGSVCHACEQEINQDTRSALIANETLALVDIKALIKTKEEKLVRIKHNNQEVVKVEKQLSQWEDLYRNIDKDLPSNILNETDLKDSYDVIMLRVQENESEREKVQQENQKRAAHNARVEVIESQTKEFQRQYTEVIALSADKGLQVTRLEILKKAFSANGLVAYKIENLVKELENLTNEYLAELSGGRFTLEFVISNDKLNVQITDDEAIVDILALSSGELARVNTSTLLAIRKLMSSISSSQINVLFLDEVINVLDDSGREKLVEVLLEEDLNTYLVSHGWGHPLLNKIEVTKNNNISSLE